MLRTNILLGALWLACAQLLFNVESVFIRFASPELSNEALVFFRNSLSFLMLMPWVIYNGIGRMKTSYLHLHALRGLLGLAALYCFFYSVIHMPLAEAVLFRMTLPFFLPVVGFLWLREKISSRTIWGIVIGFFGVLVILRPGLTNISPVALVALAGVLFAAIARTSIRKMHNTESVVQIVFYFTLISTLFSAIPMFWHWVTPSFQGWIFVFTIAILSVTAQFLLTYAYKYASPGQVGAFNYMAIIYATVFGWYFWGETIESIFFVGTFFIVIAGLLTTQAETKKTDLVKDG